MAYRQPPDAEIESRERVYATTPGEGKFSVSQGFRFAETSVLQGFFVALAGRPPTVGGVDWPVGPFATHDARLQ